MLLGPVWRVTLVKNCLVAAGPQHSSLQNLKLKVGVSVAKETHSETVFLCLLNIHRRHTYGAVARVVVNVNQILHDNHTAHGSSVQQICPYLCLDGSIYRSKTAAFCSISLTKCFIPWRFIRVWKLELKNFLPFLVFRRLGWRGVADLSTCPKAAVIGLACLELTVTAQANFENTSITVSRYLIPLFCLAIPCIPARSACHWASSPATYVWFLVNRRRAACAAYRPARFVGIPGLFFAWHFGHGVFWLVSIAAQLHLKSQGFMDCDWFYLQHWHTFAG